MGEMGFTFTTLDSTWIHCSTSCVNMLLSSAASSLVSAAKSKNDFITLNSAWRSAAQQYLLYRWNVTKICGIGPVSNPGRSNHEGGRAIDTSNWSTWLTALTSHGWVHPYPVKDAVHFHFTGSSDLAKENLRAF